MTSAVPSPCSLPKAGSEYGVSRAAGGAADGMPVIQMRHTGEKTKRWGDGAFLRWRNIAIKELP
jgi:hypothetical protein